MDSDGYVIYVWDKMENVPLGFLYKFTLEDHLWANAWYLSDAGSRLFVNGVEKINVKSSLSYSQSIRMRQANCWNVQSMVQIL